MSTLTAKLVCPECRRENEPERIYCHDCGTRLDRSALTKIAPNEPDPKETHRRLKNMFDPRRAMLRRAFFNGSKLVLGALAVAAIVQMLRLPDLPEAKDAKTDLAPPINLDLTDAASDPRLPALHYSDAQVNTYLAAVVKSRKSLMNQYLPADRVVASFDEGSSRIYVQRSLFGLPICTSATIAPQVQNGTIAAKVGAASIGRLPLHPLLLKYADFLFADVRKALEREEKPVAKLGTIELHPQQIVISRRAPQT